MDKGDPLSYIDKLNIRTDTIIINQCGREDDRLEEHRIAGTGGAFERTGAEAVTRIRVIERDEKGLSRSRNLALEKADDDICIFCDNDIRYEDDAPDIIERAFERNPEAGIICFFIERPERHRPVRSTEGKMSKKDMMRIFSPEIAVRRSRLKGLKFNEEFGAGAKYMMGEENIFLFDALRQGIDRVYVPCRIAGTLPNESSWFNGYDKRFFYNRGAGYEAMDAGLWHILSWQFIIRKRKLYKDTISAGEAYRAMKEGRKSYLEQEVGK